MNNAFNYLRYSWIFRSRANFTIFLLGSSSTTYLVVRYRKDKKLEHPLVMEALKMLEKNEQVIELVGYPVNLHSTLRSNVFVTPGIGNFSFMVRGPKGYLSVELAGNSKTHKEIKDGFGKDFNEDLEKNKGSDKENKFLTREERLKRFNIAEESLLIEISDKKQKGEEELKKEAIKPDSRFWMIDYLYAELGSEFRVVLVPDPKAKEISKGENKSGSLEKAKELQRETLFDYYQELRSRRGVTDNQNLEKSEEEMEEMRRFRMNEMYRRMGYMRFYMALVFGGVIMSTYIYIAKHRRKNIFGTELHSLTMAAIKNNQYVKQNFGENIRFQQLIRGGWIDQKAEFETDFFGNKDFGSALVKGIYDSKKDIWNLQYIEIFKKDKEGKIIQKKVIKS